jgi:hypothetical protein
MVIFHKTLGDAKKLLNSDKEWKKGKQTIETHLAEDHNVNSDINILFRYNSEYITLIDKIHDYVQSHETWAAHKSEVDGWIDEARNLVKLMRGVTERILSEELKLK